MTDLTEKLAPEVLEAKRIAEEDRELDPEPDDFVPQQEAPMKPSLNACAQALRTGNAQQTRRAFFTNLGVPECLLSVTRYWEQSYNIRPWGERTIEERKAAVRLVDNALARGDTVHAAWSAA